jgi:uncharacterized membrane protein YhaH (DUF805 family)
MLKLKWSDVFPSGSGRLGRKDYFTALFKLGAAYLISVKIITVLLAVALRQGGFGAPANPFVAPLAAALMQLIFIWPVMALASRRMADMKQSLRERYWVWRFAFPAGLVIFAVANTLSAVGLGYLVDMHLISSLGTLAAFILIMAGFLSPELPSAAQPKLEPASAAWSGFAELARTIAGKPDELPLNGNAPAHAYVRGPLPPALPVLTGSAVIVRTRSLPEQGRV